MESILEKIQETIKNEDKYSELMDWIDAAFQNIKKQLSLKTVHDDVLDKHVQLLHDKLSDNEWILNQGHVSFSNTLCMSAPCIVFLLLIKLRLLRYDEEWFEQDTVLRQDPEKLEEDRWVQAKFDFCKHAIPYYGTNPMMFYSMAQIRTTLIAISLFEVKRLNKPIDIEFLQGLQNAVVDRISILVSYPYPPAINDVDEYVHELSDTIFVPSSAFVWDMFTVVQNNTQSLNEYALYKDTVLGHSDFDDYAVFLSETDSHVELWLANMIVIASGDDLNTIFRDYFLESHVREYEKSWYARNHSGSDMSPYKILQFCRGFEDANTIMVTATQLVANLIYLEEGKSQIETVLRRLKTLDKFEYNTLFRCIVQYTVLRSWEIDFDAHVFHPLSHTEDPLIPSIACVPMINVYVVNKKTVCASFREAFSVWCYLVKANHNSIIYNKDNHEPVKGATLIDNILTYTQKVHTI